MIQHTSGARQWVAIVCLIWLGLLLGVSFLATPAKFLAPSLSLPAALDVGRHTFAVFSYVEITMAAILVMTCALAARSARWMSAGALIMAAVVALQARWLLPALDARVDVILAGSMPEPAGIHGVYVGIEVFKACVLALLAWSGLEPARTAEEGTVRGGLDVSSTDEESSGSVAASR